MLDILMNEIIRIDCIFYSDYLFYYQIKNEIKKISLTSIGPYDKYPNQSLFVKVKKVKNKIHLNTL